MAATPIQLAMRSFGRVEDLDLEFVNADRPTLVTSLLALCAGGDADHWWMQPVGIRAAALLDLLAFDQRSDRMELSAACARTACGVTFGFELPLRDLAAQVSRDETWQVALADGRH